MSQSLPAVGRPPAASSPTARPGIRLEADPTADGLAKRRPLYLRLWRGVPRELGYLVPTWIIAVVVFNFLTAAIATGASLVFLFVGIIIVSLVLVAARYLGSFELLRLRSSGLPPIAEPRWTPPFAGKTFMRAVIDPLASAHHWLYYVHGAIVNFLVAIVSGVITFAWFVTGFSLLLTPLWAAVRPSNLPGFSYGPNTEIGTDWNLGTLLTYAVWDREDPGLTALAITGFTLLGAAMVALIPFITHGMTYAHWGAARVLLARFPSEDMSTEVAALAASQRAAVVAEDHSLRRLERDIHDGPQQRLMRLQMDLASAERRMADDPAQAMELMGSARLLAQETLDELRALTQGFAPPLLQDRGLSAAIEALALRSSVPVECSIDLGGRTLPGEIERGSYFIVAELLSNAVKHAEATAIALRVHVVEGSAEGAPVTLTLEIDDNGRGGATLVPGHGLVGLTERVAGMRGTLDLASPAGGPTRIAATIPLPIESQPPESISPAEPTPPVGSTPTLPINPGDPTS
ncbi:sensor histidine kinase [Naasia lichenicola]|uniref:histidine kinase n=1 Tax=Naasia lichenicola TaxID=2565933 RepID=A0A4S4FFX1_9MICO|nr:sensor domain-containing protein [Naasia lichenicola]THG28652.1 hypothetical protein E6C64_17825 [Naasia lichenicola]